MLNDTEVYYAALVLKAENGSREANRTLWNDADLVPIEILEYHVLNQRLEIYENSPEHKRLMELCSKYETQQVYDYQVW